jgi:hypothetical protein
MNAALGFVEKPKDEVEAAIAMQKPPRSRRDDAAQEVQWGEATSPMGAQAVIGNLPPRRRIRR